MILMKPSELQLSNFLLPLLALVLALTSLGCAKETYLEIRFTGALSAEIHGIGVELTLTAPDGKVSRSQDVVTREGADKKITLPTSAAFKLSTENGTLAIHATALGSQGQALATADATTTIKHAETWSIDMMFQAVTP